MTKWKTITQRLYKPQLNKKPKESTNICPTNNLMPINPFCKLYCVLGCPGCTHLNIMFTALIRRKNNIVWCHH